MVIAVYERDGNGLIRRITIIHLGGTIHIMLDSGVVTGFRRLDRGWLVVSAVFLASAMTVGSSQYSFGVFVEPLQDDFGWSRTQISASLSFAALGGLMAPILGRIMDRHGARPVMVTCLTFFGISFLLRPMMSELWHWYGLSVLQYIGFSGAALLPTGRLVGIWFKRTRGRVIAIASMGNNFGGLVMPPVVGLVLGLASWQGAYLTLGIVGLGVALFSLVVVRERPLNGSRVQIGLSDMGGQGTDPGTIILKGWTVTEAIHSKIFYLITLVIMLGTFTYSAVLPQVFAHLKDEGQSVTVAALALSLMAALGMVGKLTFGYLAERTTARYALIVSLIGQAMFLIAMLGSSTPAVMWVSVPLFGLCMGAFGALYQLIVQETFGVRHYGSIMGLINMATVVSFACGPLLAGVSYDLTDSYNISFITSSVMFLLAAALLSQASQLENGDRSQTLETWAEDL